MPASRTLNKKCICGKSITNYAKSCKSCALVGNKRNTGASFRGRHHTAETIAKIVSKLKGKRTGEENNKWRYDKVDYRCLHKWVNAKLGKARVCVSCGKIGEGREIQWANKDHSYKRNLTDWISLCIKCHGQYDKEKGLRKHKTKQL